MNGTANSCSFYNSNVGAYICDSSHLSVKACRGGNLNYGLLAVTGGIIQCDATVPGGGLHRWGNGQIYADGVTVDHGTAQPPVQPPTTSEYGATNSGIKMAGAAAIMISGRDVR